MRPPRHPMMPEHGAQNQLDVKNKNGQQAQREQTWTSVVRNRLRNFFDPSPSSEDRNRNRDAKKSLCYRGVGRRNRRGKKMPHRHPAQNRLRNDRSQRTERQDRK